MKAGFENHRQANSKARRPWELSKQRVLSLASEMLNIGGSKEVTEGLLEKE